MQDHQRSKSDNSDDSTMPAAKPPISTDDKVGSYTMVVDDLLSCDINH